MKKLFFIVFSFLYLVSSAGVSFNVHYCGGKIKGISLFASDENGGCCGKKMKSKKCCKEKTVIYSVKETQNGASKINITKTSLEFLSVASKIKFAETSSQFLITASLKRPPDIVYNKSYRVNRVFLI
ncbi:MAG: HYC_CC_PP family protein [Bacteroidia bacterium]